MFFNDGRYVVTQISSRKLRAIKPALRPLWNMERSEARDLAKKNKAGSQKPKAKPILLVQFPPVITERVSADHVNGYPLLLHSSSTYGWPYKSRRNAPEILHKRKLLHNAFI